MSENLTEEAQVPTEVEVLTEVEVPTEVQEQAEPDRAILFELEGVAVNGRQILFDVMKGALTGKGVKLTPVLFSRYCLDVPLKESVATLLKQVNKDMDDKVVSTIVDGFNSAILEKGAKLNPELNAVLALAREEKICLGTVSCLKKATAESLTKKLGLTDGGVTLFVSSSDGKLVPSADTWMKLTKEMGIVPPLCGTFVTSMKSSKAALSAGTKCVVVTDKYNSFQDFGGADYVVDSLEKDMAEELIDLLRNS